jgi:ribosomal subunit interface protein
MIRQLQISGRHTEVSDELFKYATKKIGKLDRLVARAEADTIRADITLIVSRTKGKGDRTCEVILHALHDTIIVKETTINMYAAIDIAEAKLRQQLKRYKELHSGPRLHRRLIARLKHNSAQI